MPKQVSQSPCQKIMARSCLGVRQVPKTNTGTQQEIFQGRGDFVEFGHFDKHFVKNTRKESLTGKTFAFFSLDTLKNYFLSGKNNTKMDTIKTFYPKSGHFS